MFRFSSLFVAAASLAFAFLAVPGTGQAGGLPEGVSIEVIAEYPVEWRNEFRPTIITTTESSKWWVRRTHYGYLLSSISV